MWSEERYFFPLGLNAQVDAAALFILRYFVTVTNTIK